MVTIRIVPAGCVIREVSRALKNKLRMFLSLFTNGQPGLSFWPPLLWKTNKENQTGLKFRDFYGFRVSFFNSLSDLNSKQLSYQISNYSAKMDSQEIQANAEQADQEMAVVDNIQDDVAENLENNNIEADNAEEGNAEDNNVESGAAQELGARPRFPTVVTNVQDMEHYDNLPALTPNARLYNQDRTCRICLDSLVNGEPVVALNCRKKCLLHLYCYRMRKWTLRDRFFIRCDFCRTCPDLVDSDEIWNGMMLRFKNPYPIALANINWEVYSKLTFATQDLIEKVLDSVIDAFDLENTFDGNLGDMEAEEACSVWKWPAGFRYTTHRFTWFELAEAIGSIYGRQFGELAGVLIATERECALEIDYKEYGCSNARVVMEAEDDEAQKSSDSFRIEENLPGLHFSNPRNRITRIAVVVDNLTNYPIPLRELLRFPGNETTILASFYKPNWDRFIWLERIEEPVYRTYSADNNRRRNNENLRLAETQPIEDSNEHSDDANQEYSENGEGYYILSKENRFFILNEFMIFFRTITNDNQPLEASHPMEAIDEAEDNDGTPRGAESMVILTERAERSASTSGLGSGSSGNRTAFLDNLNATGSPPATSTPTLTLRLRQRARPQQRPSVESRLRQLGENNRSIARHAESFRNSQLCLHQKHSLLDIYEENQNDGEKLYIITEPVYANAARELDLPIRFFENLRSFFTALFASIEEGRFFREGINNIYEVLNNNPEMLHFMPEIREAGRPIVPYPPPNMVRQVFENLVMTSEIYYAIPSQFRNQATGFNALASVYHDNLDSILRFNIDENQSPLVILYRARRLRDYLFGLDGSLISIGRFTYSEWQHTPYEDFNVIFRGYSDLASNVVGLTGLLNGQMASLSNNWDQLRQMISMPYITHEEVEYALEHIQLPIRNTNSSRMPLRDLRIYRYTSTPNEGVTNSIRFNPPEQSFSIYEDYNSDYTTANSTLYIGNNTLVDHLEVEQIIQEANATYNLETDDEDGNDNE